MNYKNFPVGVHTTENSIKVLEGIVQHDNANLFQVQLYDGTEAFDFTGYNIINVAIIRPDETCITDLWVETEDGYRPAEEGDENTESHTFLAMQYIDPKNGRITLRVGGEATAMVGLHRMVIEIYSDDVVLTTARINYHVVESANKIGASVLEESEDYAELQELLLRISQISEAENQRVNQEAARQESVADMLATLTEYMETLDASIAECKAAAERSKQWAELSQSVAIEDLPEEMQDLIEVAPEVVAFAEAHLSDGGHLILPVVTDATIEGFFEANTDAGIIVYNSDDNALYVGTGDDFVIVKDPGAFPGYLVSPVQPVDTGCLWIDSGNGNIVKYFDILQNDWVEIGSVALFG